MPKRAPLLVFYFLLGAYAVCAQATLLREAQVLLFGSELSWGLVLAFWLAGVAVGARVGGWAAARARRPWRFLVAAALAMPPILVAEILFLRMARMALGVGAGEYIGLADMAWVSLAATAPVSVWVGLTFPAASALLGTGARGPAERARAVGRVYLVESAGSLVGGALFSFILVGRTSPLSLTVAGGACLAAAAAALARDQARWRPAPALFLACAALHAALVLAGATAWLDSQAVAWRWHSFAPGLDLVESVDSRYQNIAIGQLGRRQFSLYTNGTVAATWPNHTDLAIEAHLAACQHPAPKHILVLGGGLEGKIAELERHRPERLDYVTLDRVEYDAVYRRLDAVDRRAADRIRPQTHFADARRYVKSVAAAPAPRYDLVVLAAAEPASALEARLYTEEFFAELSSAMADDGVLAFSLTGSVGHWGPELAAYVACIVRPLQRVFPEVALTFGNPVHVFAARRPGVLAPTGELLAARYRERGLESPYFDPVWFEGASDILDPEKRAQVRRTLDAQIPEHLNTDDQPAAAVYFLRYWLTTTEAAHAERGAPPLRRTRLLADLLRLRFEWVIGAAIAAALLASLAGLARGRRSFRRAALLWSVGTTGFASMAAEIVLLYTFQTLYGYVYSMIGLVVGVFMFGLVGGSHLANRRLRAAERGAPRHPPGLLSLLALDLALVGFASGLVLILAGLRASAADWPVQAATFGLVAVAGLLGGFVFPVAAAVRIGEGEPLERAAGTIDAADHWGACAGALVTGVALVPVLGITGTCLVVAAMKALSALVVGAAAMTRPASPGA
ncbi:MAG TPA: hypothetical protein VMY35_04240 [Phycisphaerae bacterium]|nr:hypothetical protein [Phycisphaerae bacterium]